jgi:hypothetical protein
LPIATAHGFEKIRPGGAGEIAETAAITTVL